MGERLSNTDKINYGFALLRMLMAFEVILAHFCSWEEYDPVLIWPFRSLNSLTVTCFAIMSFYLMADFFLDRNKDKFKNRLIKLIIPQIAWAFVYYVIYASLDLLLKTGLHNGIQDLFWQMLTGHSQYLNPTMWYQFNLVIITILFYYIFKFLDDKKAVFVLIMLMLFCYYLQFSGINRALFENLIYELKFPLGRIAEMIPFCVIGFLLKYYDILNHLKKYRYLVMVICVALFYIGFRIPWIEVKDFDYSGFAKPYLSLCIITFAYLCPFEYLADNYKKLILKISNYTLGIYCSHRLIYTLLQIFVPELAIRSFERCVLIYLLCYFLSWIIYKSNNKYIKQTVN